MLTVMSNQVPSSEASYISIAVVTSINAWQKANDNNVKRLYSDYFKYVRNYV